MKRHAPTPEPAEDAADDDDDDVDITDEPVVSVAKSREQTMRLRNQLRGLVTPLMDRINPLLVVIRRAIRIRLDIMRKRHASAGAGPPPDANDAREARAANANSREAQRALSKVIAPIKSQLIRLYDRMAEATPPLADTRSAQMQSARRQIAVLEQMRSVHELMPSISPLLATIRTARTAQLEIAARKHKGQLSADDAERLVAAKTDARDATKALHALIDPVNVSLSTVHTVVADVAASRTAVDELPVWTEMLRTLQDYEQHGVAAGQKRLAAHRAALAAKGPGAITQDDIATTQELEQVVQDLDDEQFDKTMALLRKYAEAASDPDENVDGWSQLAPSKPVADLARPHKYDDQLRNALWRVAEQVRDPEHWRALGQDASTTRRVYAMQQWLQMLLTECEWRIRAALQHGDERGADGSVKYVPRLNASRQYLLDDGAFDSAPFTFGIHDGIDDRIEYVVQVAHDAGNVGGVHRFDDFDDTTHGLLTLWILKRVHETQDQLTQAFIASTHWARLTRDFNALMDKQDAVKAVTAEGRELVNAATRKAAEEHVKATQKVISDSELARKAYVLTLQAADDERHAAALKAAGPPVPHPIRIGRVGKPAPRLTPAQVAENAAAHAQHAAIRLEHERRREVITLRAAIARGRVIQERVDPEYAQPVACVSGLVSNTKRLRAIYQPAQDDKEGGERPLHALMEADTAALMPQPSASERATPPSAATARGSPNPAADEFAEAQAHVNRLIASAVFARQALVDELTNLGPETDVNEVHRLHSEAVAAVTAANIASGAAARLHASSGRRGRYQHKNIEPPLSQAELIQDLAERQRYVNRAGASWVPPSELAQITQETLDRELRAQAQSLLQQRASMSITQQLNAFMEITTAQTPTTHAFALDAPVTAQAVVQLFADDAKLVTAQLPVTLPSGTYALVSVYRNPGSGEFKVFTVDPITMVVDELLAAKARAIADELFRTSQLRVTPKPLAAPLVAPTDVDATAHTVMNAVAHLAAMTLPIKPLTPELIANMTNGLQGGVLFATQEDAARDK